MKILVFGDIHGRTCWKDIYNKESPDLTIFLGDYFTSRDYISEEDQVKNFDNILKFKLDNDNKVILLRGNHDTEALGYSWAECYPVFYKKELIDKDKFIKNTQWVYTIGDFVFSHAGISKVWFENLKLKFNNINTIEDINNIEPNELFGFTPDFRDDYYGESKTQPLTWIRPSVLTEYGLKGKTFICGHTRFPKVVEIKNDNCNIYCCDCLPYQYITIENNKVTINNFESTNNLNIYK